jgi:hypothetical protein
MAQNLNVDVLVDLYARVRKLRDGSEEADAAERAISMTLSEKRRAKDKELLLNDVLRNGRHSVRRSRARFANAVEESGQLASRGIATGATRGFVDYETPEHHFLANELTRHLEQQACRCGRHGPRVLEGLLDGETSREMMTATGVSASTINRTVRRLRDAAIGYGYASAA